MVQSIDARSAATADRVPSFRLIDLHKVLQQRIFVPGHYAWKVHKLKGIKLHHGQILVLDSPYAGVGAILGAALRRY